MRTVQADGYVKEMRPSGKVKVFLAGAAGSADGAGTATGGAVTGCAALADGATGAVVAVGVAARSARIRSLPRWPSAERQRQDQFLAVMHIRQGRG